MSSEKDVIKKDILFYLFTHLLDLFFSITSLAVPLLAIKIGASVTQLGMIGTTWALSYSLLCFLSGRLSDRFGRNAIVFSGCIIVSAVFFLMAYARSVDQILILVALSGVGLSFIWPPMEATIAEGKDRSTLIKTIGIFGVAWSSGVFLGPVIGGYLYQIDFRIPFFLASGGSLICGALSLFLPVRKGKIDEVVETFGGGENNKLYAAWVANFVAFFTRGVIGSIFPKLAEELGIKPGTLGILFGCIAGVQMLTFAIIAFNVKRYRTDLVIPAHFLACFAMVITYTTESTLVFGMAFALVGLTLATTFYSSAFYSLFNQKGRGTKAGVHEAMVGMGFLIGPFTGGLTADKFGLGSPYLLCLGLLIAGILVQIYILKKKSKSSIRIKFANGKEI